MKSWVKFLLVAIAALCWSGAARAQGPTITLIHVQGVPIAKCTPDQVMENDLNGDLYDCLFGLPHLTGSTGGGAVSSVFGRTGVVVAASNDYSFSQISGSLSLGTQVTGTLPIANNCPGATGASSSTFLRGDCTWATPAGGGNVSNSGTPSAGQAAEWTSATQVQGVGVTGTGNYVKATSPTLVTPALGTPSAINLANATGAPTWNQNTTGSAASLSVSGQTGILTFTGIASTSRVKTFRDAADTILELGGSYTPTGTWTNMILATPNLGTPSALNLTNATLLPCAATPAYTGDVTKTSGSCATTVGKLNGTTLSSLATGILKNTTGTGVPSIAVAGDFPTLNQNTNGSAASISTTQNQNTVLAGPSGYGSAAAAPTSRLLVPQDLPASYGNCEVLDYALCTSAVSGGNPSFISQGTCTTTCGITINGTGLTMFIGGQFQQGSGTYTNAITGIPASGFEYVYVKQDISNAALVAADFGVTNIPPVYSYITPTACTGASSTNPEYWFDMTSRTFKVSTAAACSFSVASPQILPLGVVWVTATPTISGIAHEPCNLSPYRRYELFGDGFDAQNAGTDLATQQLTSGTTTLNNWHTYAAFELTGATVNPTTSNFNGSVSGMTTIWSQNPVLIVNTSSYTATGLGRVGGNGATGAGSAGINGGFAGGAGAGGGGGTGAGGNGGGRQSFANISNNPGQPAGGAVNTVGTAANSTPTGSFPICQGQFNFGLIAGSGGGGGGDGTHAGGTGGAAGGAVVLRAPGVVIDASSGMTANGGNGVTPGTANAGGGGAGGGGTVAVCGGYLSILGTFTASAGTVGSGAGTGGAGGAGAAGIVQQVKLW